MGDMMSLYDQLKDIEQTEDAEIRAAKEKSWDARTALGFKVGGFVKDTLYGHIYRVDDMGVRGSFMRMTGKRKLAGTGKIGVRNFDLYFKRCTPITEEEADIQ